MHSDPEPAPGKEGESEQEGMVEERIQRFEEQRLAGLRQLFRDVLGEEEQDDKARWELNDWWSMSDEEWEKERENLESGNYVNSPKWKRLCRRIEEFANSDEGKEFHERQVKLGTYQKMHECFVKATEEMDRRMANQERNDER